MSHKITVFVQILITNIENDGFVNQRRQLNLKWRERWKKMNETERMRDKTDEMNEPEEMREREKN